MAHAAAGAVLHLAVLHVIARARKQVVVAAVVEMHVADDDGLDALRIDAERAERLAHRLDDLALAAVADRLVEAGIDHDGPARADDRPDVVVERLDDVVRIGVDVVVGRLALMVAVADGVDLVDAVGHVESPTVPIVSRAHRSTYPGRAKREPGGVMRCRPGTSSYVLDVGPGSAVHRFAPPALALHCIRDTRSQLCRQIVPHGIVLLDERDLPLPTPPFDGSRERASRIEAYSSKYTSLSTLYLRVNPGTSFALCSDMRRARSLVTPTYNVPFRRLARM